MGNFTASVANALLEAPSEILSISNIKNIETIASFFPEDYSSAFGFECRLGNDNQACDFSINTTSMDSGAQKLIQISDRFDTPCWNIIREFSKGWVTPFLKERTDNIWLEFDSSNALNEEEAKIMAGYPSFFFGLNPSQNYKDMTLSLLKDAIIIMIGDNDSKKSWHFVEKCVQNLNDKAFVFQCGAMLSRKPSPIRLCIRGFACLEIPKYLKTIGWSGNIDEFELFIKKINSFADSVDLDLDILEEGIGPKVGIEVRINPRIGHPEEWVPFLDFLFEHSLALPQKIAAVKNWHSFHHQYEDKRKWPSHNLLIAINLGLKYIHVFENFLHHIKINFLNSDPIEAKAYLGTRYAWIDHQRAGSPSL
ncbi:MAG: hypothetical protein HQK78_04950 [Desulfobacterales bacterium]|nr:hypothetical protein [Desulfobacterales bacterium]